MDDQGFASATYPAAVGAVGVGCFFSLGNRVAGSDLSLTDNEWPVWMG